MMETQRLHMRELLRRLLEHEQEDPEGGGAGGWHATIEGLYHASSNGICHRQNWYKRRGYPSNPGPLGLFKVGHLVEDVVHAALQLNDGEDRVVTQVECLAPLSTGGFITGRTDSLLLKEGFTAPALYPGRKNLLMDQVIDKVEIAYDSKSTGYRDGKAVTKPTQSHQVAWYAKVLRAPEARIVHPGRNDILDIPEKDSIYGPAEIWKQGSELERYFVAQHELDKKDEVPPTSPRGDKECDWCNFRPQCKADGGPHEGALVQYI